MDAGQRFEFGFLPHMDLADYLPQRVNSGPWLSAYTLPALKQTAHAADMVLPICSLGTPYADLARLGDLVLPPLFHEALDGPLKTRMLNQISRCFPEYSLTLNAGSSRRRIRVVELPRQSPPRVEPPGVLAFSVDTAVEEHGPHLPLATDTIQSYAVLTRLAAEFNPLVPGPPIEYGQLTWGLPFGFSIDITAELLTAYVRRFTDAVLDWLRPQAVYVVDVHGSLVHRRAIVTGLEQSRAERWRSNWRPICRGSSSTSSTGGRTESWATSTMTTASTRRSCSTACCVSAVVSRALPQPFARHDSRRPLRAVLCSLRGSAAVPLRFCIPS